MFVYRLLCRWNDDFALLVFAGYCCLFLLAAALVFVFPPGALALVLIGTAGLIGIWAVVVPLRAWERSIARRACAQAQCPRCSSEIQATLLDEDQRDARGDRGQTCSVCLWLADTDGYRVALNPQDDDDGVDNSVMTP